MDKDKGVIQGSIEKWTRGVERTSPLDQVSEISLGEGKREGGEANGERERSFRERSSTFSLEFPTIGPAGSDEARG